MITLPLAEVRAQLSKLVEDAVRTHERIEVTKNGRRAAVILSADDYDSLIETVDILSDPDAMSDIREAAALPDAQWISGEAVQAALRAAGRLRP